MSNPAWPVALAGVSFLLKERDFLEYSAEGAVTTTMDSGRIKRRKRFTVVPHYITGSVGKLTSAQVDALTSFYENDCAFGTLPFDWTHPRTKAATSFFFTAQPQYKQLDTDALIYFQATITLQVDDGAA